MALANITRISLKSVIRSSSLIKPNKNGVALLISRYHFPRFQCTNSKTTTKSKTTAPRKCADSKPPQCGDHFKGGPCETKQRENIKLPQPAPEKITKISPDIKIKRNVDCCGDPCPDALPRFDLLYYRRSDKLARFYEQTWNECPELVIKPKVICTHKIMKPKLKKRPRQERPQTACKQEICLKSKSKCPHIRMPRCQAGRKPPSCLTQRKPATCFKRNAPFPAFSECSRKKPKGKPVIECRCLNIPSICEVWAYHHKQMTIKKPSQC